MSIDPDWRDWLKSELDDPEDPIGPTITGKFARECIDYIAQTEAALEEAKEKNGELHMVNHELHRQLAESERKCERLTHGIEAALDRPAAERLIAIACRDEFKEE